MRGLLRYIHTLHTQWAQILPKYGLTQNFFPFLLNEIKHGKNLLYWWDYLTQKLNWCLSTRKNFKKRFESFTNFRKMYFLKKTVPQKPTFVTILPKEMEYYKIVFTLFSIYLPSQPPLEQNEDFLNLLQCRVWTQMCIQSLYLPIEYILHLIHSWKFVSIVQLPNL